MLPGTISGLSGSRLQARSGGFKWGDLQGPGLSVRATTKYCFTVRKWRLVAAPDRHSLDCLCPNWDGLLWRSPQKLDLRVFHPRSSLSFYKLIEHRRHLAWRVGTR
jgi:hypothetical protein